MPVEIPLKLKYRRASNGRFKSSHSVTGISRHRGEADQKRRDAAQQMTKANRMVLVLVDGRHRRFVRADSL